MMSTSTDHWCLCWLSRPEDRFKTRQAIAKDKMWRSNDNIRVTFMDGDPAVWARIKQVASQWVSPETANLKFVFLTDPSINPTEGDIRITFKQRGSWSRLGTDCQAISKLKPSMNFGWLTASTPEEDLHRVVLHEFGHALGLIHEHQNPEAQIEWDWDGIKRDLGQDWTDEEIEFNVTRALSAGETNHRKFDPLSIMIYPFPATWNKNGLSVSLNKKLSDNDISFIHEQYP
jgi:serralysin